MSIKFKKIYFVFILFMLFIFTTYIFAQDYGEITSYTEKIYPNGEDALIISYITIIPNNSNEVFIPFNKNLNLIKYKTNSSLLVKPELIKINGKTIYKFTFSEKMDKYEIELYCNLSGLYKSKKAKMKDSHPGGVTTISYKFINYLPVIIKNYQIYLYIPDKKELYEVLSPSKKFKIDKDKQGKYVYYKVSKISPFNNVEVKINIYTQSSKLKIILWITIIIVSIILLIKRFNVIKSYKKE